MTDKERRRFEREFERIERGSPLWAARLLAWLRQPYARLVRIPAGIFLILGGLMAFLPVLGLWMLPLGFLLLAIDLPILQGPVGGWLSRLQLWWMRRKHRKRMGGKE